MKAGGESTQWHPRAELLSGNAELLLAETKAARTHMAPGQLRSASSPHSLTMGASSEAACKERDEQVSLGINVVQSA